MADIFTKKKRSEIMSKIRAESKLEKEFAQHLSKKTFPLGYRYRLHYKKIPGRPDIAFVSRKLAIFIDGDFWHGYRFSTRKKILPKFWIDKIETNMRRDRKNRRNIKKIGWEYIRIWEHEIKKDPHKHIQKIINLLGKE